MIHFTSIDMPRLQLRRFTLDDLPTFVAYRNDPDVARYQGWEAASVAACRAIIIECHRVEPGLVGEWFQFALERRADRQHIGDCALYVDNRHHGEIGYTLAREYWGQGYATEAVGGLIRYLFQTLRLPVIHAIADTRNAASIRVLQRSGMQQDGPIMHGVPFKGELADEIRFVLTRDEWKAQVNTAPTD